MRDADRDHASGTGGGARAPRIALPIAASAARVRPLLAAPLARFFLLGAALFGAYALVEDAPPPGATEVIAVDAAQAARLAEGFRATWRRDPTPSELDGLISDWIVEEAYVREARALGLDRGDAVIRQRLRQKMRFFAESGADAEPPAEAELRAHFEANAARFTPDPRIAFEQIYLGEAPPPDAVAAVRAALAEGADPRDLGAATMLPSRVELAPPQMVDGAFGSGFFARIDSLAPGEWAGPVASGFGAHLVRVTEVEPPETPPFETVRPRVEDDWRRARAEALRDAFTEALLARYAIMRPDPAAALAGAE